MMRRRRGSILIIVLWALFILSALAIAISGYARAQISIAGRLSQSARDYYLARAGVERAIIEVSNCPAKEFDSPGDPWRSDEAVFKDVRFGDGVYSVFNLDEMVFDGSGGRYGMSDEESKININKAPVEVLKNIFKIACGIDDDEAVSIATSIVNWRSPADAELKEGAGEFYYEALERPYRPKNAPFDSLGELVLVKGVTGAIFDKVKSRLTVYGDGAVNINSADDIVLRALGISEESARAIISFRGGGSDSGSPANVFEDNSKVVILLNEKGLLSGEDGGRITGLIAKKMLSVESDNFGGIAVGRVDGLAERTGAKIAFIFDRKNNVIRYWKE